MHELIQQINSYRDFKVVDVDGEHKVFAYNKLYPLCPPLAIELNAYRHNLNGNGLAHMQRAYSIIWPQNMPTWNSWTERRFQAHIEGHKIITWAGGANALALDELVLTADGWTTIGELKIGDKIINPVGGLQTVDYLHEIKEEPYLEIALQNGTTLECSEEHFWPIRSEDDEKENKPFKKYMAKDIPLLMASEHKSYYLTNLQKADFPERPISDDPYLVGFYIGSVFSNNDYKGPVIRIKKDSYMKKYLEDNNFVDQEKIRLYPKLSTKKDYVPLKANQDLRDLSHLPVEELYIPDNYLYNTEEVRKKLFAGILDARGLIKITKFSHYLETKCPKRMLDNLTDLSNSLGYQTYIIRWSTHTNDKNRKIFRLEKDYEGVSVNKIRITATKNSIHLPLVVVPQRSYALGLKEVEQRPGRGTESTFVRNCHNQFKIKSIKKIGNRKGRCITVSGKEGAFVTKNYMVTGNCGKSFDAANLALLFWLANPQQRTVLVASTSLTDLDARIWGYLKLAYKIKSSIAMPGELINHPSPKILSSRADTVHGMFAVPLQKGTANKTSSTLIGRHPEEGLLVIIDEGTDVTPGFMSAIPNWEKSPIFQCIVIGNSCSMMDPHGLLSRPILGWDSINPDYDNEWKTKHGICLYFDCYQSPAITDPDEDKRKLLSKFLFTEASIQKSIEDYGEKSPEFYRFTRGFWAKEDVSTTVLTPITIDKFGAMAKPEWSGMGTPIRLASLDPAFTSGGDDCILRFGTLGTEVGGLKVLDFGGVEDMYKIKIDSTSSEPTEYQIVHQVMELCKEMGVGPENFAIDVHGMGSGLGAIFENTWSRSIYKVSSAGPPSNTFVDAHQELTARDVYDRRVTELWFSMQKFVNAGQIRGLDDLTCQQLCTRKFEWKGRKYCIETKQAYKERLGKVDYRYVSPDQADAACMMLDLARQFYGFIPGVASDEYAPASLLQKYFDQQYRDGQGPTHHQNDDWGDSPGSWEDGFMVSQFDVVENDGD